VVMVVMRGETRMNFELAPGSVGIKLTEIVK